MPLVQEGNDDLDNFLDVAIRDDNDVNHLLHTSRRRQQQQQQQQQQLDILDSSSSARRRQRALLSDQCEDNDDDATAQSCHSKLSHHSRNHLYHHSIAELDDSHSRFTSLSRDMESLLSEDTETTRDGVVGVTVVGAAHSTSTPSGTTTSTSTTSVQQNHHDNNYEQLNMLEREIADMKVQVAEARSESDWYKLQHRQLQVEFEDLQAFCEQLQKENLELRNSGHRTTSRRPHWFKTSRLNQLQKARQRLTYSNQDNGEGTKPPEQTAATTKARNDVTKDMACINEGSMNLDEMVNDDDETLQSTVAADDASLTSLRFMTTCGIMDDSPSPSEARSVRDIRVQCNRNNRDARNNRSPGRSERKSDTPKNITVTTTTTTQQHRRTQQPPFSSYVFTTSSSSQSIENFVMYDDDSSSDDDDDERPEDAAPASDVQSEIACPRKNFKPNNKSLESFFSKHGQDSSKQLVPSLDDDNDDDGNDYESNSAEGSIGTQKTTQTIPAVGDHLGGPRNLNRFEPRQRRVSITDELLLLDEYSSSMRQRRLSSTVGKMEDLAVDSSDDENNETKDVSGHYAEITISLVADKKRSWWNKIAPSSRRGRSKSGSRRSLKIS